MQRCVRLITLSLLSSSALLLFGCPPTPPPGPPAPEDASVTVTDAGKDGGNTDGGGDAGVDAGFFCKKDDDCSVFKKGLRCEQTDGGCVPAASCGVDSNCRQENDPDHYCYYAGPQCRCALGDPAPDSGFPGVCRRRKGICEECTADDECGPSNDFDPPGKCTALKGDATGKKYCLQAPQGFCGCGMVNDGQGLCVPQSNSCSSWGCAKDADCDPGSVCNTSSCLCERKCRWDFAARKSIPECGPGLTCWVDSKNLDPTSIYYGSGRCHAPCKNDSECQDTSKNPNGGPNLKCAPEDLGGGSLSALRCRANGDCMDSLECPSNPPQQPELGFCDRGTFQCRPDCRIGTDPTTTKAFPDCQIGYKCDRGDAGVTDAGVALNSCVRQSCADTGGTQECARGQLCCGEDRNNDKQPESCPQGVSYEANRCFNPPTPPYCHICNPMNGDSDCAAYPGLAPNDGGAALPNLCWPAGTRPGAMEPTFVCMLSTVNDFTISGGQLQAQKGCPALYTVNSPPIDFVSGTDNCQTDQDCSLGGDAGSGHCGVDPMRKQQDGGPIKSCLCDNTNPKAWRCPSLEDGGFLSVCPASPGIQVCARSIVCAPPSGMLFVPKGDPTYGCGL